VGSHTKEGVRFFAGSVVAARAVIATISNHRTPVLSSSIQESALKCKLEDEKGCDAFFPSVQKLRIGKRLNPTSLKTLEIVVAVVFETKHLQLYALLLTGFGTSLPPVLPWDQASIARASARE
jgi:hypothetical protein